MKISDVVNVAKGVKVKNNIPLNSTHLSTLEFGKTHLTYANEILPKDSVTINMDAFTQLAPINLPVVGGARLYSRWFFVPYRFVWRDWEAFYSQKGVSENGTSVQDVPYLTRYEIFFSLFAEVREHPTVDVDSGLCFERATSVYDIEFNSYGTSGQFIYSSVGAQYLQILQSLGYPVTPYYGDLTNSSSSTYNENYHHLILTPLSAMPLLSLAKVFRDFYVNPNFDYSTIDSILRETSNSRVLINYSNIRAILEFVRWCWYENDIFTSAWANPEQLGFSDNILKPQAVFPEPWNQDLNSDFVSYSNNHPDVDDPTSLSDESLETYYQTHNGAITQRGLNVLKALRNWTMRFNVAGGRFIDRVLAEWDIRLSENEARRSKFLGAIVSDLSINRIDATAAGSDGENVTALGDFAGKGLMSGNGTIKFSNDNNDFGMLLCISHILPDTHYYQGVKPYIHHNSRFDFLTPDLENVGNAPIPNDVVFDDYRTKDKVIADSEFFNGIFGFHANYYENKVDFDRLTGDFRLPSRNTELESFHMFRTLDGFDIPDSGEVGNRAVLNEDFLKLNDDNIKSYLKIFNDRSNWSAHFVTRFRFNIIVNRFCTPLQSTLLAELNEHGNDVGSLVKIRKDGKYF